MKNHVETISLLVKYARDYPPRKWSSKWIWNQMVWQSLVYFLTNNTKNLWDSDDDVDDNLCGEMFIGTIASLWHLFKISFSNPWEGGGCFVDLDGKKNVLKSVVSFRGGRGGAHWNFALLQNGFCLTSPQTVFDQTGTPKQARYQRVS